MSKEVLIIAGEKSGEEHAMSFLPELKRLSPDAHFFGVGGDLLKDEGVELLYHLKEFSSMGFSEVIGKLPFYFKALDHILSEVKKRNCKTAILVDFQGFNLKLAMKLKKLGVNVLYYVAPQAWAWKAYRAKKLEKSVHTLYTILPFEKEWFQKRGVTRVRGVPHPLMAHYENELHEFKRPSFEDFKNRKKRILLLPGSRNSEVFSLLEIFSNGLHLIKEAKIDFEVAIVKSTSVREENYEAVSDWNPKVYKSEDLSDALKWADIAIAASGTVTLATGLFSLPTIVCYRLSPFNEFIATNFISYDGPVSLTNIIHNEYVFPEYLMYKANRYNIFQSAKQFLTDENVYNNKIEKLNQTKLMLSGESFNIAESMANVIGK